MNPQSGGKPHLEERPQVAAGRSEAPLMPLAPTASAEEAAVLECLRTSANALTPRQLRARVSCAPEVLEQALQKLMERELVIRLNTIVPSYSYRQDGMPTHEG